MQALGLVWRDVDALSPDCEEICSFKTGPCHPGGRLIFESWRRKQPEGGLVIGRDLPSRELSGVLRNLAICEPVDRGADFRVRLAGTGLVRRYGCDITGTMLSQLYDPQTFQRCLATLTHAMNGIPSFWDVKMMHRGKVELQFESMLLPVRSPDLSQIWVLGGVFYPDWVR
jgi:hypothetical protein